MLMDDDQLIYVSHQHMVRTLQEIASLGVDVVKVSVVWQLIAPNPDSGRRPKFDATDPAAYPAGAWKRYDDLVETAQKLGLKVYFLLIGPAPNWAIPKDETRGQGPVLSLAPDPSEYGQFVEAVGKRYSGSYVDPSSAPDSSSGTSLPVTVPSPPVPVPPLPQPQPNTTPAPQPLPRVDYWGIWNEPNERSWLTPWHRTLPGHRLALTQPELYRGLVDFAWQALAHSGHADDTVMIGETANRGVLGPIPFVRDLYCVSPSLQPLVGQSAAELGCPTSGSPGEFVGAHPGLFLATGYAHHPYGFDVPPNHRYPDRGFVTLYNLPSFERILNGIFAAYGQHPANGVQLYLTEWGYKTNPPNPYVRTSLAEQAVWLDQGDYLTWQDPYVQSLTQFLLIDSPPKAGAQRGTPLYWSTFQTGLENMNGSAKPALAAFRLPIWIPVARHGPRVTVWGQLRPANHGQAQWVAVEFRARGSNTWTVVTKDQTASPEGFIVSHVSLPSAGDVRLAVPTSSAVIYSRTASVS